MSPFFLSNGFLFLSNERKKTRKKKKYVIFVDGKI